MARARKSHKRAEEKQKARPGERLPPINPQAGTNPYVVYCDYYREDVEVPKVLILAFAQPYSAAWFVNQVIEGNEWEWTKPIGSRACIRTEQGIRISMFDKDKLKEILEYEPTEVEAEWEDEQIVKYVQRFKYGRAADDGRRGSQVAGDEGSDDEGTVGRTKRGKRKKAPRESKPERVKIDKTGLISANDIAKELGVEGREVRGVLRAMKLEKPAGGWLFDKKTADEIREKVKKGLKERKKK